MSASTIWSWATLPGIAVRSTASFVTAALLVTATATAKRSPTGEQRSRSQNTQTAVAGILTSVIASIVSFPSVLKIMDIGLPANALSVVAIYLGLALGARAWPARTLPAAVVGTAYAVALVFGVPAVVVRGLA